MPQYKLYGFGARYVAVLLAAHLEGVEVEGVSVNPYAPGGLPPEYRDKLPLGLVPVLEYGDFQLTECIAIALYVVRENKANLLGATAEQRANVLRWMSFANFDLMELFKWFAPLLGRPEIPFVAHDVALARSRTLRFLLHLEQILQSRTFLVGERITLADVFTFVVIAPGFPFVLDRDFRERHPNIMRWFETVYNFPPVKEFSGPLKPRVEKAPVTPRTRGE
ncbi:hypothetical protein JCM10908_004839 [Rhodotorula pacifica]|uniref:glutathione S-transferase family protein n=1 Tax=Rhodotorula pacifica TaxID=1495444 RepID=UPI003174CE39